MIQQIDENQVIQQNQEIDVVEGPHGALDQDKFWFIELIEIMREKGFESLRPILIPIIVTSISLFLASYGIKELSGGKFNFFNATDYVIQHPSDINITRITDNLVNQNWEGIFSAIRTGKIDDSQLFQDLVDQSEAGLITFRFEVDNLDDLPDNLREVFDYYPNFVGLFNTASLIIYYQENQFIAGLHKVGTGNETIDPKFLNDVNWPDLINSGVIKIANVAIRTFDSAGEIHSDNPNLTDRQKNALEIFKRNELNCYRSKVVSISYERPTQEGNDIRQIESKYWYGVDFTRGVLLTPATYYNFPQNITQGSLVNYEEVFNAIFGNPVEDLDFDRSKKKLDTAIDNCEQ